MKRYFLVSLLLMPACGSSDKESAAAGRTMVVEVGDGVPGLYLGDTAPESTDTSDVSAKEIQQCKDLFTGTVDGWKIAGSENNVSIEATQAFAVKITGHQNILNLTIKAKEGETSVVNFPGMCLVLGGNQPTVNVVLNGVALEHFKVIAQGNSGKIDVKLQKEATLPEGTEADIGKHATMTVTVEQP